MDQLTLAPWESNKIEWGEPCRVITWNVNGIRAAAKKGLFDFLEKFQPTIFCTQETKAFKDQCEPEIRDLKGYTGYWHSAKKPGYSGVATFSKTKPSDVLDKIGIKKFDEEGRFILTKHEHFSVINMYFPNGGMGPERQAYKMEFLKEILPFFKKLEDGGHKLVICGDYNIAHKDIDVYDPKALAEESGFLPEERKWLDKFEKHGFVDTYRHFHPEKKHAFTWWSYFKGDRFANHGWRIDYICISKSLLPHLKKAEIYPDVLGSDHCPVLAEFEF